MSTDDLIHPEFLDDLRADPTPERVVIAMQLIQRLSAKAERESGRLEQDYQRVCAERDEAREQVAALSTENEQLRKGDSRAGWTYRAGAGWQPAGRECRPLFSGNIIASLNNWAGQKRTQAAGWRAGAEARDDSDQRQRHMERADLRDQEAAEIELLAKVTVLLDMDGPLRTALVEAIEAWDVWPAEAPGDSTTATRADQ